MMVRVGFFWLGGCFFGWFSQKVHRALRVLARENLETTYWNILGRIAGPSKKSGQCMSHVRVALLLPSSSESTAWR